MIAARGADISSDLPHERRRCSSAKRALQFKAASNASGLMSCVSSCGCRVLQCIQRLTTGLLALVLYFSWYTIISSAGTSLTALSAPLSNRRSCCCHALHLNLAGKRLAFLSRKPSFINGLQAFAFTPTMSSVQRDARRTGRLEYGLPSPLWRGILVFARPIQD